MRRYVCLCNLCNVCMYMFIHISYIEMENLARQCTATFGRKRVQGKEGGGASWIEKGEVGISEPVLRFRYPCSVCISRWWIFLVWFLRWRDGGDGVDPIHGFVVGFWGVDVKIWVYVCHYMYMCMYMYAGSMGGAFRGWLEMGVTD